MLELIEMKGKQKNEKNVPELFKNPYDRLLLVKLVLMTEADVLAP